MHFVQTKIGFDECAQACEARCGGNGGKDEVNNDSASLPEGQVLSVSQHLIFSTDTYVYTYSDKLMRLCKVI